MGIQTAYTQVDEGTLERLVGSPPDALGDALEALEAVDVVGLLAAARFDRFAEAGVYPGMWAEDPVALRAELADAFALLFDAHRSALAAASHVVVSIW